MKKILAVATALTVVAAAVLYAQAPAATYTVVVKGAV